jgi:two-component system OmpR family response regulator
MPETILVIDDDALLRWTMAADLEEAGFRPAPFESGRQALRYLADGGEAAAVLLDLHLPESDGPAVLHQLRAHRPLMPVLFMTGADRAECKDAAAANGAAGALDKTQSFTTVLQHLRLALARAAATA